MNKFVLLSVPLLIASCGKSDPSKNLNQAKEDIDIAIQASLAKYSFQIDKELNDLLSNGDAKIIILGKDIDKVMKYSDGENDIAIYYQLSEPIELPNGKMGKVAYRVKKENGSYRWLKDRTLTKELGN